MVRHRALSGRMILLTTGLLITMWGCSSSVDPAETFLAWWPVDGPIGPDGSIEYVTQLIGTGTTIYAAAGPSTLDRREDSIIVGDSVWIFRSQNNGDSWTRTSNSLLPKFSELIVTPAGTLIGTRLKYLATHDPVSTEFTRSTDDGATWISFVSGIPVSTVSATRATVSGCLHGLSVLDGTLMMFLERNGGTSVAYTSQDEGASWLEMNAGSEYQEIRCASQVHPQRWLIGTDNGVRASADNGASWHVCNAGLPTEDGRCPIVRRFTIVNDSVVLISIAHHDRPNHWGVYRSTDGGESWLDGNIGLPEWGWTLLSVSSGAVYACESMSAFRSFDGGAHWGLTIRESCIKPESPKSYLCTPDGHFLGGGKGVFKTSFALK